MKITASIFLSVLFFLTVQPLFSSYRPVEKKTCCMKMGESCQQNKEQSKKTGKCDQKNCNPFMACSSGNFYTLEKNILESYTDFTWREKSTPKNDNRLATCSCECWHPPEDI